MKTLDIDFVEKELEATAKYYMEDILKDRLGGQLREWFDAALRRRGMSDVVEIPRPTRECTTVGDTTYKITRLVTPTFEVDVDDMRRDASEFIEALREAVDDYVRKLPSNVVVVNVPALYVSARAYMVKWFIWGYLGTPVERDEDVEGDEAVAKNDKQKEKETMDDLKLTDEQYERLIALRPALSKDPDFVVGLPYRTWWARPGHRVQLYFPSLGLCEGERPGFDAQVDTPAVCMVLAAGEAAHVFAQPNKTEG